MQGGAYLWGSRVVVLQLLTGTVEFELVWCIELLNIDYIHVEIDVTHSMI